MTLARAACANAALYGAAFLQCYAEWYLSAMLVKNRLSILIPLYNEEEFIAPLLERVISRRSLIENGSGDYYCRRRV